MTARVRSRACTGQSGFHVYIRNFERSVLQLPGRGVVREFVEEITRGRGGGGGRRRRRRRRNEEDREDRIGKDRKGNYIEIRRIYLWLIPERVARVNKEVSGMVSREE